MRIRALLPYFAGLVFLGAFGCQDVGAAVEGSFERTFKVTGPVDLAVTTGSGFIRIRPGAFGVVQINALIRASEGLWGNAEEKVRYIQSNPPVEQSGNVIRIGHIDDARYRQNVSISYEVTVPAETRLQSKTGSGSQSVEGIRGPITVTTGSGRLTLIHIGDMVHARTGSGSVELDGANGTVEVSTGSGSIRALNVAGAFKANTGSGDIRLEQTAPGDVDVSTGSGSVEVSGIRGSLQCRTGSGHINAAGKPSGEWNAHAASGSITLTLDSGAAFDVYARTSSGRVIVNHPITVQGSLNPKEIRGKVKGGGPIVEASTGSGNIVIQ